MNKIKRQYARRNEASRTRHLMGVRDRRTICASADRTVRYAKLTMAGLASLCSVFLIMMVLAAIYLPLPRDMHLPAPAEEGRVK